MVKNKGGNKTKGKSRKVFRQKELGIKDLKKIDNQEYGFVISVFGDGRYELMCYDKKKRLGILRGRLRRTVRIQKNDLVLVSLRGFQDDKCDIIANYSQGDIDKLIKEKEIYTAFAKSGSLLNNMEDKYIVSSDDEDNEETSYIEKANNSELNIGDI